MVQNIVLHLVGQRWVARHMAEEATEKLEAAQSDPWGTARMVQNIVLHLVGQNIQERRRTWRTACCALRTWRVVLFFFGQRSDIWLRCMFSNWWLADMGSPSHRGANNPGIEATCKTDTQPTARTPTSHRQHNITHSHTHTQHNHSGHEPSHTIYNRLQHRRTPH